MALPAWFASLGRSQRRSRRRAAGAFVRRQRLEELEARILLAGDVGDDTRELLYTATSATPLTLRQVGTDLQVVNTTNPAVLFASKPLSEITIGIRLEGANFDVSLTIDASVTEIAGGVLFVGGSGTDTLLGPAAEADWVLDGPGTGLLSTASGVSIEFVGVENLRGGAEIDSFKINPGGSVVGTISGGGNDDALLADNTENLWQIQGANQGNLNSSIQFEEIENLIGGTGNDTFAFDDGASVSGAIVGGGETDANADGEITPDEWAVDTLDYSAYTTPVTVQLGTATATALGSFSEIDVFTGGISSEDQVLGPADQGLLWRISGPDEVEVANAFFSSFENLVGASSIGIDEVVNQYDLQLMAWGDGSAAPTSGTNLIVIGTSTDSNGRFHLHTRIFDARGNRVLDTDSTNVAENQTLKQLLPGLLSPHVLTNAEKTQVITALVAIVGEVLIKDNDDAFLVEGPGSLSGSIDGGTGGTDDLTFVDPNDAGLMETFLPSGADSFGIATLFGKSIEYAGLDEVETDSGDMLNPVVSGTQNSDTIAVSATHDGGLAVQFVGNPSKNVSFTAAEVPLLESLRINGMGEADTIEVKSLPANFSGSLLLYGNRVQGSGSSYPDMPQDDIDPDNVIFSGDITLGYLEVFADHITVKDHVRIDTGEEDIFFRSRMLGQSFPENLTMVFASDRSTSVDIGKHAVLQGGSIYVVLQTEDKSLSDVLGAGQEITNFVIDPLTDVLSAQMALPVKVLVKQSSAAITVQQGAELLSSGTIGLYATASADASGVASSSLVSIGYGRATARATVDIQEDVIIDAAAAVVITSTGSANASISSNASRQGVSVYNVNEPTVGLAVGVADAHITSHITIAEGASITSGKTANIIASGEIGTEASGETGLNEKGVAGLAFGIQISNADIHTRVDGHITARMEPGSVVKLEIDPLVAKTNHTSDQVISGLEPEQTVELKTAVNADLPAGTILKYIGVPLTGQVNLATQTYSDPQQWERSTPAFGYVDYATDRIFLGDVALVTEDTINYTNRRGTSIGNLVNNRDYYVIADAEEPGYFWLAETETQAIRAGLGYLANNIVPLDPAAGPATENNDRTFAGTDVDADNNTITLPRIATVNNTFALGQAVIYRAGPGNAIPGLIDGNTYYVAASTDETNLNGDTRFTDKQVFGLAETENEARAGVLIDLGSATGNSFTLSAKHVLDSGFATGIGIVSQLNAENNASASAGLAKAGDDTPWTKLKDRFATTPGTFVENALAAVASQHLPSLSSDQIGAGLALAISDLDHKVLTDVGSKAVLKSNEDLEVVAKISQNFALGAESATESTAELGVSVALNVGTFDNTAIATIHSDADTGEAASLDALRATRVIADVTYPFLTRLDEYIPLSWGELVDSLRTEGAEAVTKYLTSTLGFKEAFFNTWVASTAEAEKASIAASVNILVANNTSQAIVKSGVRINQDDAWHHAGPPEDGGAANEHPNQAQNQDDGRGEQVVSIEATNYEQTLHMTGIFSLPSLQIDPSDLQATKRASADRACSAERVAAKAAWVEPCSSTPATTRRMPSWKMAPKSTAAPTAAST